MRKGVAGRSRRSRSGRILTKASMVIAVVKMLPVLMRHLILFASLGL